MSIRNNLASYNQTGVSAAVYESAINTAGTCNLGMLVDKDAICQNDPRLEDNSNEAIGKEEPDTIYNLGGLATWPFKFSKAQPQHFAFICGYGLGSVSVAAAGAGYKHTIVPITFDHDEARSNPSFTLVQRFGNQVLKERFSSMFIDSFVAEFMKDDWCKLNGTAKGTGYREDNVYEETLTALDNAVAITLAANGVEGATAATRLANVHRIIAETSAGVWEDVTYTAVSSATPAVITIASMGGAGGSISYKVMYIPDETATAWCTFPSRVSETPLRTSQLSVIHNGKWNGSAISGGHTLGAELKNLKWSFNNTGSPEFTPGSGNLNYADRFIRSGRKQTVDLGREFRDYVYQQHIDDEDTFLLYCLAEGAIYDTPHKYTVEVVFPKVAVKKAQKGVDNNRLSEAVTLQVLEDDTYGSVVLNVKNLQAKYCQAS